MTFIVLLPEDYDTIMDDAFAYQSKKLLERIKKLESLEEAA